MLLLLPPESRALVGQRLKSDTETGEPPKQLGLVAHLVKRMNQSYDLTNNGARIQLSCYGELMARACSLGMLQLGGAIKVYSQLLSKRKKAVSGVIGLCTLMLRNWEPVRGMITGWQWLMVCFDVWCVL